MSGRINHMSKTEQTVDLRGTIVSIENADPGYDWIFGYGIKGLITKFGGVNSHMAIRCSELRIPAAIGIGETLFSKLNSAHFVTIDCLSESWSSLNDFMVDWIIWIWKNNFV